MDTTRHVLLHDDAPLIERLGGPSALARRLGYSMPGGAQRVQNWKYRGIPEVVRLRHPDIFRAGASLGRAGKKVGGKQPKAAQKGGANHA